MLRRYGNSSRSGERLPEPPEHRQIRMESHALQAANPEGRQAVLVFERRECSLHGGTTPVEITPTLCVAGDTGEQAPADSDGHGWLAALRATKRDVGSQPRSSHSP